MNEEVFAYRVKNEGDPLDYLDVNNSGIAYATESSMHGFRPGGRNDYLMIYVHGGSVKLKTDDKTYTLKGHCIIYRPYEKQDYTYVASPDSEIYWLHFNGIFAEKILSDLKLDKLITPVEKNVALPQLFKKIIFSLKIKEKNYKTICNYRFLKILSILSNSIEERNETLTDKNYSRLQPAILAINERPNEKHTIEKLAALCFMSKSTFIKVFTKVLGMPPISYVMKQRLENSLYLLLETDYSISEIAERCGYESQFYYSKQFKQNYGCSPLQYRKSHNE